MPVPQIFLLQNTFEDFEIFSDVARAWDLDFVQIDKGGTQAHLLQYVSSQFNFGVAKFNRHYHQRGSTPEGMRTFAVIEENVHGLTWFGQPVNTSSLLCFPKSRELESVSLPGFHVYTLAFSEELIEQTIDQLHLPNTKEMLRSEATIRQCDANLMQALRMKLRKLANEMGNKSDIFLDAKLCNIIETEILHNLLSVLADSMLVHYSAPAAWKRSQVLVKTKELLAEAEKSLEFVTLKDLCMYANVSDRMLRYVFHDYYGVSPHEYLKSYRLKAVRKELLLQNRFALKVSDVANKWGFWHMGQFAQDYKQRFGELPSETIKKH